MKRLAVLILILNAGLWFGADYWQPRPTNVIASEQTLPRVATLKVESDSASPQSASDEIQKPAPEPIPSETAREKALPEAEPAVPSGPEPEAEELASDPPESLEPDRGESMCVRLGWFENADQAREAYESLNGAGPLISVSEQERALAPLHWVIIPPQPEDRALAQFNDLQRRNIDSYLVTQGENTNAISLGLFQSKDAAERVLAQKKRQNLNAVLANFPRNELSYALVFEALPVAEAAAGNGRFQDYQEDFEMVEISACEGIATTPENP